MVRLEPQRATQSVVTSRWTAGPTTWPSRRATREDGGTTSPLGRTPDTGRRRRCTRTDQAPTRRLGDFGIRRYAFADAQGVSLHTCPQTSARRSCCMARCIPGTCSTRILGCSSWTSRTPVSDLEYDLASVADDVATCSPVVDRVLLDECRAVVLAIIAAHRWSRDDRHPSGRGSGHAFLDALRHGPPWPTLDQITW